MSGNPWLRCPLLVVLLLSTALALEAQVAETPRTRTFSGLVSPAFPYARPDEVDLSSERLDRLGDEITEWIAGGELVGAELLVVKHGKAVFHEAYGWSDREAREPMRRNSVFAIQSMSKPFTATAALMLVEEGNLSIDDPVSRYVPDFDHEEITVHHLLSHTSGFVHDGDWYDFSSPGASLQEFVETWRHRDPEKPLGTYDYADFNYAHLGYIVTKVTGTPVETFIEERILRPLALHDTTTGFSSDPVWRSRLNAWYRWNERAGEYDLRWPADWHGWTGYPAAWGMFSTAMDYAEFMALWLHGGEWKGTRLLTEATVEEARRSHGRMSESFTYGYGWFIDDMEGAKPFGHSGGGGTHAIAYPADDAIVIFLTQSRWGPWADAFWNRLGMSGLFEHPGYGLNGLMVWASDHDAAGVELSPQQRARHEGAYEARERVDEAPEVFRVWREAGRLHVRMGRSGHTADQRFHLVPKGGGRFGIGRYEDSRLQALDPDHEIRIVTDDAAAGDRLQIVRHDQVLVTAWRSIPDGSRR